MPRALLTYRELDGKTLKLRRHSPCSELEIADRVHRRGGSGGGGGSVCGVVWRRM